MDKIRDLWAIGFSYDQNDFMFNGLFNGEWHFAAPKIEIEFSRDQCHDVVIPSRSTGSGRPDLTTPTASGDSFTRAESPSDHDDLVSGISSSIAPPRFKPLSQDKQTPVSDTKDTAEPTTTVVAPPVGMKTRSGALLPPPASKPKRKQQPEPAMILSEESDATSDKTEEPPTKSEGMSDIHPVRGLTYEHYRAELDLMIGLSIEAKKVQMEVVKEMRIELERNGMMPSTPASTKYTDQPQKRDHENASFRLKMYEVRSAKISRALRIIHKHVHSSVLNGLLTPEEYGDPAIIWKKLNDKYRKNGSSLEASLRNIVPSYNLRSDESIDSFLSAVKTMYSVCENISNTPIDDSIKRDQVKTVLTRCRSGDRSYDTVLTLIKMQPNISFDLFIDLLKDVEQRNLEYLVDLKTIKKNAANIFNHNRKEKSKDVFKAEETVVYANNNNDHNKNENRNDYRKNDSRNNKGRNYKKDDKRKGNDQDKKQAQATPPNQSVPVANPRPVNASNASTTPTQQNSSHTPPRPQPPNPRPQNNRQFHGNSNRRNNTPVNDIGMIEAFDDDDDHNSETIVAHNHSLVRIGGDDSDTEISYDVYLKPREDSQMGVSDFDDVDEDEEVVIPKPVYPQYVRTEDDSGPDFSDPAVMKELDEILSALDITAKIDSTVVDVNEKKEEPVPPIDMIMESEGNISVNETSIHTQSIGNSIQIQAIIDDHVSGKKLVENDPNIVSPIAQPKTPFSSTIAPVPTVKTAFIPIRPPVQSVQSVEVPLGLKLERFIQKFREIHLVDLHVLYNNLLRDVVHSIALDSSFETNNLWDYGYYQNVMNLIDELPLFQVDDYDIAVAIVAHRSFKKALYQSPLPQEIRYQLAQFSHKLLDKSIAVLKTRDVYDEYRKRFYSAKSLPDTDPDSIPGIRRSIDNYLHQLHDASIALSVEQTGKINPLTHTKALSDYCFRQLSFTRYVCFHLDDIGDDAFTVEMVNATEKFFPQHRPKKFNLGRRPHCKSWSHYHSRRRSSYSARLGNKEASCPNKDTVRYPAPPRRANFKTRFSRKTKPLDSPRCLYPTVTHLSPSNHSHLCPCLRTTKVTDDAMISSLSDLVRLIVEMEDCCIISVTVFHDR